jgi:uncharacterized membrane protein
MILALVGAIFEILIAATVALTCGVGASFFLEKTDRSYEVGSLLAVILTVGGILAFIMCRVRVIVAQKSTSRYVGEILLALGIAVVCTISAFMGFVQSKRFPMEYGMSQALGAGFGGILASVVYWVREWHKRGRDTTPVDNN